MRDKKKRWVICCNCEGDGRTDHPAFANGFTSSEWEELESEAQAEYLQGTYDVACKDCSGSGKVLVPNISALSFAERRALVRQRQKERGTHAYAAEAAAERRALGGF
ncbi:hypothetical protein [Acidovorax sp.]|uniref:hypothetical protein n=1 Tax=Acidovorax sp. TaxID=1872122 RepID=UPI00391F7412